MVVKSKCCHSEQNVIACNCFTLFLQASVTRSEWAGTHVKGTLTDEDIINTLILTSISKLCPLHYIGYSLVMKLINSETHSCIHSLASFDTCIH